MFPRQSVAAPPPLMPLSVSSGTVSTFSATHLQSGCVLSCATQATLVTACSKDTHTASHPPLPLIESPHPIPPPVSRTPQPFHGRVHHQQRNRQLSNAHTYPPTPPPSQCSTICLFRRPHHFTCRFLAHFPPVLPSLTSWRTLSVPASPSCVRAPAPVQEPSSCRSAAHPSALMSPKPFLKIGAPDLHVSHSPSPCTLPPVSKSVSSVQKHCVACGAPPGEAIEPGWEHTS